MKLSRIALLLLALPGLATAQERANGSSEPAVEINSPPARTDQGSAATPLAKPVEEAERNDPGILVAQQAVRAAPQEQGGALAARAARPPAATASTEAKQEKTVSLDELLQEALSKNPSIATMARRVDALRARVPQVKSPPDPVVSVGWMGNIAPFSVQHGDPSSYRAISAMEEFPYPGKLKLRGDIADREAEAARWELEAVKRQIVADVKASYYDYAYYNQAIKVTRKDKDLLQKLAEIAEVRYKVGKGLQQDVLSSQTQISLLLQKLTVLEQAEKIAQVRVNTLLYRDPEAPLDPPAPIQKAELTYSPESLYQLARDNDTGLQGAQRTIERNQYAVSLARRDYLPDFRVSYMYQQRPDLPDMNGFTVGINVPVFYKTKQRQAVVEASQELASVRHARESRETELYFQVKQQYLMAKSSDDLARLYSQAIVPQSTLALESSLAAYEVGKVDFLNVLTNFLTVLDYEVNYYRELSNYQIALARLEPLVGMELTK
jgi:outer membrane protein TolC